MEILAESSDDVCWVGCVRREFMMMMMRGTTPISQTGGGTIFLYVFIYSNFKILFSFFLLRQIPIPMINLKLGKNINLVLKFYVNCQFRLNLSFCFYFNQILTIEYVFLDRICIPNDM